jgi:DNA polymerase-1
MNLVSPAHRRLIFEIERFTKSKMVEVQKKIENKAKMIIQVHDELVIEVEKELAQEVSKEVKDIMEQVITLRVPIKVGLSINESWGEMK